MADISLYLTNVNVSVGRTVDAGQSRSPHPHPGKDPDSVELELEAPQREKAPRRIIHFSSGETMEEYSTDDDDEEEGEEREAERKDLLSPPVDASKMPWGPYFWFHMWRAATSTISACDYLGERMASLFGITSAKYQYAIDEYYRIKKEKEEEAEENRLSEEAERSFGQVRSQEQKDEAAADAAAGDGGQDAAAEEAARPTTTYQVENESRVNPNTITVPVIVTAT